MANCAALHLHDLSNQGLVAQKNMVRFSIQDGTVQKSLQMKRAQRAHLKGELRLRRWKHLHFEDEADTILDVVRIDAPDYDKPLLLGTIARELTTEQIWLGYKHRSPVETNFYVPQDSAGMEMPRAWTENALKRRISLAMLAGFVLKAIAANCEPLPIGPWDLRPKPTAGRLTNYLDIQLHNFVALAESWSQIQKLPKNSNPSQ